MQKNTLFLAPISKKVEFPKRLQTVFCLFFQFWLTFRFPLHKLSLIAWQNTSKETTSYNWNIILIFWHSSTPVWPALGHVSRLYIFDRLWPLCFAISKKRFHLRRSPKVGQMTVMLITRTKYFKNKVGPLS